MDQDKEPHEESHHKKESFHSVNQKRSRPARIGTEKYGTGHQPVWRVHGYRMHHG